MKAILKFTIFFLSNILVRLFYRVSIPFDSEILGLPIIRKAPDSKINFGFRCRIVSSSLFTDLGVSRPVIIRTKRPESIIEIGNHVGLSGTTIVCDNKISIGDYSMIGADVIIADTDFHQMSSEDRRYAELENQHYSVRIGKNVFIGARSIILKGVEIGDNSVIGAGSIVTNLVEENSVYAGNPARKIRSL